MKDYLIRCDSGPSEEVRADSRGEAIRLFCERHGMPMEFFKNHCVIKLLGNVTEK